MYVSVYKCVRVCVFVLGGAAFGEVGVQDGCRHSDYHCNDRHPGAPAALSRREKTTHRHTHTHGQKQSDVSVNHRVWIQPGEKK